MIKGSSSREELSPRLSGRIAGLFYLRVFVAGAIGQLVSGGLVTNVNALAMANSIPAHKLSIGLSGLGTNLIMVGLNLWRRSANCVAFG